MRSTTLLKRPLSDPIAEDQEIGNRIGAIAVEIAGHERDLDKLRVEFQKIYGRIKRLEAESTRLTAQKIELIPEVQDVERLRSLAATRRGMR